MKRTLRARAGFTLMELLISIAIFILLGVLLVALMSSGVEVWSKGEVRRDAYERASILFDQLRADLSCAVIHREIEKAGVYTNFSSRPDSAGRPVLWFTRVGAHNPPTLQMPLPKNPEDTALFAPPDPMKRNEIVYCFDPDPAAAKLYRGQFLFDKDFGQAPMSTFEAPAFVRNQCSLLMEGVIYLGFRFWSQDTDAWSPLEGEDGPEARWDSTRFVDAAFALKRRNLQTNDPLDDVLPRRVEITVTLERPGAAEMTPSVLRDVVDAASGTLPARLVGSFPAGPGFAKIDNEWIAYERKTGSGLSGVTRGVRGTQAVTHDKGAVLRWGDTFTTVVGIPAYKDDPNR